MSHLVSGTLKDQTTPCLSFLTSPHASTARRLELTGAQGTLEPEMLRLVTRWLVKVYDNVSGFQRLQLP